MRVSLAAKPQGDTTTPGLAVKFLIDGHPSLNFMSMYSLDGQKGYNFFKNDFSNFLEPPQNPLLKTLASVFSLVSIDPTKIDVSFLASRRTNGELVPSEQRVAPYQIFLLPNREELNFADAEHEVRDDFATIAPGTRLYTVYALLKGSNQRVEMGTIETKDRFVASSFGDSRLFFRHEAIDEK